MWQSSSFPKGKTQTAGCSLASLERWLNSHVEGKRSVVDETVFGSVFSFSTGYLLVFCSSVASIVYRSLSY